MTEPLTEEDLAEMRELAITRRKKRGEGLDTKPGKYYVRRLDGRDRWPDGKHYACRYFVLDLTHDPYAVPALRAYADACEREYPKLADELRLLAQALENPGDTA